nr:MAG TPA: hypothetical protein [Herelleviridae sp.]
MKTQVFTSKEECVEHYLKLQGKRIDFTEDEVRDFLNTNVSTNGTVGKKAEEIAGLPTYAVIRRVVTWSTCPEVYAEVHFPEFIEAKGVSSIYILTFKEQEDGTYKCEVPDFKILY